MFYVQCTRTESGIHAAPAQGIRRVRVWVWVRYARELYVACTRHLAKRAAFVDPLVVA